MLIDYKFWYIKRNDAGFITEATVRFFTGDITTELETDSVLGTRNVTRYRRTQRVNKTQIQTALNNLGITVIFDMNGNPAVLLTPTQFGNIKTENELRIYCNAQLAKFGITPISEQI